MPKLSPARSASAQRDDVKDWSARERKHLVDAQKDGVKVGLALMVLNHLDFFLEAAPMRANRKAGGKGKR